MGGSGGALEELWEASWELWRVWKSSGRLYEGKLLIRPFLKYWALTQAKNLSGVSLNVLGYKQVVFYCWVWA